MGFQERNKEILTKKEAFYLKELEYSLITFHICSFD